MKQMKPRPECVTLDQIIAGELSMKQINPRLECTSDYSIFVQHEMNRPLHEDKTLLDSMRRHGFIPGCAISCIQAKDGKMKVLQGHHRLHYAQRLGLPVYYIVHDKELDIFDLENARSMWTVTDFINARARSGDASAMVLKKFMDDHGLGPVVSASLVGGESAGSNNQVAKLKRGRFRVGDMTHAEDLITVIDQLKSVGCAHAKKGLFINALSCVLRIPDLDIDAFVDRLKSNYQMIVARATVEQYLDDMEVIYNYRSRKTRLPLKHMAREAARQRTPIKIKAATHPG